MSEPDKSANLVSATLGGVTYIPISTANLTTDAETGSSVRYLLSIYNAERERRQAALVRERLREIANEKSRSLVRWRLGRLRVSITWLRKTPAELGDA